MMTWKSLSSMVPDVGGRLPKQSWPRWMVSHVMALEGLRVVMLREIGPSLATNTQEKRWRTPLAPNSMVRKVSHTFGKVWATFKSGKSFHSASVS